MGDINSETTDIDSLFEEISTEEKKGKDFKIEIIVPNDNEEQLDDIRNAIKVSLEEYKGIKIK